MQKPATAPWNLPLSTSDLQKLKAGFIPEDQDDKWYFYTSPTATEQLITVHIVRNMMNVEMFVLEVTASESSGGDIISAEIKSITWETSRGCLSEEEAKYEAVMLVRVVLRCEVDALPAYESDS
ncbi:hypothetical protein GLAREA_09599 [Glarea lozoyensis ATCC 20868]|uniref:Uncharacterized protein n=1 Tax=Glarea lozoyensis (strain ATCC 20868 / MF5171) TaxID=1116229 RepID=S3DPT3_GLAL2|nr:uncharacterized protein GLAREA_09599 [Glarea lozoyensis ATCC 20868]EPE28478.1 hypothetical protein GLAREA_09599 [Glarea lozoyensis ATCC 20868]